MLVHHADPLSDCIPRIANARRLTPQVDRSGIGLLQPVEDLHQGGFAGAIFADQSVNLPGLQVEADPVVGPYAGENFGDFFHR